MNTFLQKRWLIDATLFAGFLACFFLDLTGVGLHQWLGLAAGVVAVYHLLSHLNWVSAVARRFFDRISGRSRLYFLIDALLLAGFAVMLGTGLAISTWLGLSLAAYETWYAAHVLSSLIALVVLVLKIGLHGQWILVVGRRVFASQDARPAPPASSAPFASGSGNPGRRAFIRLMAGVGAASLLAISQPFQNANAGASGASTESVSAASESSDSTNCVVRCGRRCSYPGRCRRYVDGNANGCCDLGECLG